jgi:hypothetical protein
LLIKDLFSDSCTLDIVRVYFKAHVSTKYQRLVI